jgi:hypothetical protein
MGDHDKQVSWLAAWSPLITFPDIAIQWFSMRGTPLTVAGAARAFNPIPLNPLAGELVAWPYGAAKRAIGQLLRDI